ncbi:hypothetical protein MHK_002101 [Candidatus Magnetomorum sp. HK-1]|nr:hypothetical protein MHK_002101 [Candidatus Magnetomorum sp. HK-1]
MIKIKKLNYLDEEEKDLEKAINSLDIKSLSLPDKKTQNKFKTAAKRYSEKKQTLKNALDKKCLQVFSTK